MRIVESLTLCEILFDGRPSLDLSCIREEHTDDGTLFCGLFDREECFARHPSVSHGLVIGFTLTLSHDNVESVVAQVTSLTRSLNTITDNSYSFVFQYFTCFFQ